MGLSVRSPGFLETLCPLGDSASLSIQAGAWSIRAPAKPAFSVGPSGLDQSPFPPRLLQELSCLAPRFPSGNVCPSAVASEPPRRSSLTGEKQRGGKLPVAALPCLQSGTIHVCALVNSCVYVHLLQANLVLRCGARLVFIQSDRNSYYARPIQGLFAICGDRQEPQASLPPLIDSPIRPTTYSVYKWALFVCFALTPFHRAAAGM